MHLPQWQQTLFYAITFSVLGYMGWQIFERARLWRQGKPIDWKPNVLGNFSKYVLGQKRVQTSRAKTGAPMHLFIFYGFASLVLATTLLAINTYLPWKFHKGTYYLIYEATFDATGLILMIGILWAMLRRVFAKPRSVTSTPADLWALLLIFVLGVTGYVLEAARIANDPKPFDGVSFVGTAIAPLLGDVSNSTYVGIWWFHMVWVWLFFAVLPKMRIRHIVLAIFSTSGSPDRPMGRLEPISMESVEETGKIGVTEAHDYSRWHLMSLDACMECGRCTDVCPANGVGKILNPKQVVQDVRNVLGGGTTVAEAVSEEALWACTTCNACVEACPVLIRHVDLIVDARRGLVAEGRLSGTAATMLRQSASTGNAWGATATSREDWMAGIAVPLAREKKHFEVLLWIGCAGATDPGAIKTSRAVAGLLLRAGVDFACLGNEEKCTGDPAKRTGDEFLAQELAQQNIERFKAYGVRKIVTPCPHCFNTLNHEYGDFGGHFEVWHHTQFLQQLVAHGKLNAANGDETVYHDPCYLARINNESDAPRALLGATTQYNDTSTPLIHWLQSEDQQDRLLEPEHFGRKTLCCGAGGGRMWMEESPEQRPSDRRAKELLATGAKTVAVGCPFCRIMLDSGIKKVSDEEIRLIDIAELLAEKNLIT